MQRKKFIPNPVHFHELTADLDSFKAGLIWLHRGRPVHFERPPSTEDIAAMGVEKCSLGERYRKNVRCPVNGDGYWYLRVELIDDDGRVVGSVTVPDSGGEL